MESVLEPGGFFDPPTQVADLLLDVCERFSEYGGLTGDPTSTGTIANLCPHGFDDFDRGLSRLLLVVCRLVTLLPRDFTKWPLSEFGWDVIFLPVAALGGICDNKD